ALTERERYHSEEIKRIDDDRFSSLQGAGIDDGAVRRQETTVSGLEQAVRRQVELLPRIQEYKTWL
ncbi:hypothetical protein V1969_32585, partial [Pseudomonas aeruginosa]